MIDHCCSGAESLADCFLLSLDLCQLAPAVRRHPVWWRGYTGTRLWRVGFPLGVPGLLLGCRCPRRMKRHRPLASRTLEMELRVEGRVLPFVVV